MMNQSSYLFAACFLCASISLTQTTFAQKDEQGPVGIFNSQREYHEFMGGLKSLRDPEINAMLPTLNDIVLGQPIGDTAMRYGVGKNGVVDLLGDPSIRKELDMVDSQYEDLKRINGEFQSKMREQLKSLDMTDAKEVLDTFGKITNSAESRFEGVLLPHQIQRLRQLSVRNRIRQRSLVEVITSDPVATELDVTEKQKIELRKSEELINQQLAKDIEALRKKAQEKLLSNLKKKQRDKLETLIGDEFEFSTPQKKRSGKGK